MATASATPLATAAVAAGKIDPSIQAKGYAHPGALVSTTWLADHLTDPRVRVLESD